ncbi:hypothetical protein PV10_04296 [Exophiala mesophila]|uniref:Conserved oligomeric Golgi complex subunit 2 n=1 Tax=Exophiala mesophila TaxID=212818 RepID=A0A0D1XXX3_EXOME|nr:uncharacterized protein PV10_04296 [Exophiala mesophila]KIV93051.1 hypothetical protein PV10_04296 [Exophiala mesophila]
MSSRFYFGEDSDPDASDNDTPLPFPKPLDREAFLAPDFDPTAFLSTLSNRFQTLEDLQTELRELSQALNKELIDLVNENYQDFLTLGSTLSGGEDKIEEIRLGLLGFQRDVKGVRDQVEQRREDILALLKQKKALAKEASLGRGLLEIAERLDELENNLRISKPKTDQQNGKTASIQRSRDAEWSETWEEDTLDDSDDEFDHDDDNGVSPRLRQRTDDLLIIKHLIHIHNPQHPFILAQDPRLRKIQESLVSSLETTIKREPDIKVKQRLLQLRSSIEG